MTVYQIGDVVNVVKGTLPKTIPDAQFGFEGDKFFVKVGGVSVPVASAGGTVAMSDTIPFNGKEMTVANPDLTAEIVDGDYYIGGKMAVADPAVKKAWGYGDDVNNLFVIKVTFDGDIDPETFSGTCVGTTTKPITYSKLDGPDFIYYIFSGAVKEFTITYKANAEAEEKTIKIYNNAVLEGAEVSAEETAEEPTEPEGIAAKAVASSAKTVKVEEAKEAE